MKHLAYSILFLILLVSAKSDKNYYNEKYRPQVHFSPEKDWLFETNGLVYDQGQYHLFYQNVAINNKILKNQLGHAVSKDLVRWQHLPFAFVPDEKASDINSCRPSSGSAVIDSMNITGLGKNNSRTILIYYSDNKGNQNLAFSNDQGTTWTQYDKNPLISNPGENNHDPKVFYHAPTKKWIMALYCEKGKEGQGQGISFYNSSDLIHWNLQSFLEGFDECPDIVEVGFDDKSGAKKWVVLSGAGNYQVGYFDGLTFRPETGMQRLDLGKNYFAMQTLSNAPNGKTILMAWMRGGEYPEMPFNGQLSFPMELSLRSTKNGPVLCRKPVEAIGSLYGRTLQKKEKNLIPGIKGNLLNGISGDAVYIKAVLQPKTSDNFGIVVRDGKKSQGTDIQYDTAKKMLNVNGDKMPLEPVDGRIMLEIILDRSSIEVLGNNGITGISTCFSPVEGEEELLLYTQGGELFVESLEAFVLESAWTKK